METNKLKKFAQEARVKLLQQIEGRLNYVLLNKNTSTELLGKTQAVKALEKAISSSNLGTVVEKTAYTWFNRLIALRFMDANGYQPLGIKVVSSATGNSHIPELLDEVNSGRIPSGLKVDEKLILDILDGRVVSTNPDNEVYRMLLVAACNGLHEIFPFLFEEINDYTELLLPEDLTSDKSIIYDVVKGMDDKSCTEVEIIGWLYQFYISEKKKEVDAAKGKVKKEDLPAKTQLFTPRWIVEYMVQNTVGKLWLQNNPQSSLKDHMPYYIESSSAALEDCLKIESPEEITLLDQACGSGHILVYGFELLSKIYEEEGYSPSEIPALIIKNNLFGFEIDDRASQLASMAIMMKAREYHRRFFRKGNVPEPNILCYQDLTLTDDEVKSVFKKLNIKPSDELIYDLGNMRQATNFGSLIVPHSSVSEIHQALEVTLKLKKSADAFIQYQADQLYTALGQLDLLARKYHCVVDNPPYMGARKMDIILKEWLSSNYSEASQDLFSAFMKRCSSQLLNNGIASMITLQGWMFVSSFAEFRRYILSTFTFDSLIQVGGNSFPSLNSQVARAVAFTVINKENNQDRKTISYDLDSVPKSHNIDKQDLFNKYIASGKHYFKNFNEFKNVSRYTFLHSIEDSLLKIFQSAKPFEDYAKPKQGLATGNNYRFVRYWFEVPKYSLKYFSDDSKWFLYNKGGDYKKWYGNNHNVVNWENNGIEIKSFYDDKGKLRSRPQNEAYYFRKGITYSLIGNSEFCARAYEKGHIFDVGGSGFFPSEQDYKPLLGLVNSKVGSLLLSKLNPTVNFQVGDIANIPVVDFKDKKEAISKLVDRAIELTKRELSSSEINIEFNEKNELILEKVDDITLGLEYAIQKRVNALTELIKVETEINDIFYDLYNISSLGKRNSLKVNLYGSRFIQSNKLPEETIKDWETDLIFDFISFFIANVFDRINFLAEHSHYAFYPDDDNIIPVLDDEWFEDDIVGRFHEFLKASFGEKNFVKNLQFVEDCLGKDIRKYLTKDFYKDHIKRYKSRPIYWMFSSPKGHFKVLVYLHRYTPDTLSRILNNYLREFMSKLSSEKERQQDVVVTGAPRDQAKALKEIDKIEEQIDDCLEYEAILRELALERIELDLDDGVLVNYNKMGKAVATVKGLNDAAAKKKVRGFDWIDTTQIR